MVNKTFLSLAIAAVSAGLAGCNISSVDGNDKVDARPIESGAADATPERVAPIFSAGKRDFPLNIDFLFAEASTTDGTAKLDDTTPPVTTAINRLDGFSTAANMYVKFNADLDPETVVAGQTVFLVKLKNADDNAEIDALDIASIVANSGGSPVASDPLVPGTDYEARFITLDNGNTPVIQILPKTPLEPKTKYIVVLTDGIRGVNGTLSAPSAEYELTRGDLELPSSSLQPVRTAVRAWETIAGGFLQAASQGQMNQDNVILSYAFTTTGTTDVLTSMAAPGVFLAKQFPSISAAETAITASIIAKETAGGATSEQATQVATATLNQIALLTASLINEEAEMVLVPLDDNTRTVLKGNTELAKVYLVALVNVIADGSGAGLDAIVDLPASRQYSPIPGQGGALALPYDAFLSGALESDVRNAIEAQVRANPDLAGANEEIIQAAITEALNANLAATLQKQVADISSGGAIYQGGLTLPNFLPEAEAGVADAALGYWSASNNAAVAMGEDGALQDDDGALNVTYRFPFADKLGDATIPVMATMPAATCDPDGDGPLPAINKPADGWPVVIYQHGITVDRTAGVLVGNALASQCIAMVAIDHAMHGVAPLANGEANKSMLFNVEQVAAMSPAINSPFAKARALYVNNVPDSPLANLKERHNNVGKDATNNNIAMVFKGALADPADVVNDNPTVVMDDSVGSSGDLYINLQNFMRTRDGMRQTVLDLLNLNASLDAMDVNGDGMANELDSSKVYFIGHSLGGIIGTTFLAVNNNESVRAYNSNLPEIKAAALGNPGGGVVKLLENSPTIGARILAGLSAKNIQQGSSSIESFFSILQATVDSADPINFASQLSELPILVYEDVGVAGDNSEPSDQVVPNNALNASPASAVSYLAGTDSLVDELGITDFLTYDAAIGSTQAGEGYYYSNVQNSLPVRVNIRLAEGSHSTFSSANPLPVFQETYLQIISFFDPHGFTQLGGLPGEQKGFLINNTDILENSN